MQIPDDFADDGLDIDALDPLVQGGRGVMIGPLAMGGGLVEPAVAEQTGELAADVEEMFHFAGGHRLAGAAGVESAQVDALAEAFGKIARREHCFDHLEDLELDPLGLLEITALPVVIEFHDGLGRDPAGGDGAAVAAHQEGRQEDFLAADQAGEVGTLRLDLAERVHEPRHVAAAVLDADDARAIEREAPHHLHADLVGELRDVVEENVDRGPLGQLAEVVFDALLRDIVVIGAGHRDGGAAEVGAVGTGFEDEVDVGFGGTREDRHASGGLIGDDGGDLLALREAQPDEFAGAAIRIESADPLVDEPADIAPQLALVDAAVVVEGNDVGCENALDLHEAGCCGARPGCLNFITRVG